LDNTAAAEMGWDDSEEEWTFSDSVDVEEDLTVGGTTQLEAWGDSPFTAADGLLLLGPGCPLTETAWTSLRGQTATISGAFHTVAGRWTGTRALVVEPGKTNYIADPAFGNGTLGDYWTQAGLTTFERSTTRVFVGTHSVHCIAAAAADQMQYSTTDIIAADSEDWYLTARLYIVSGSVRVRLYDDNGAIAVADYTELGKWIQVTLPATTSGAGAGHIYPRFIALEASEWYLDAVQLEKGTYPTTFIYGEQSWSAWNAAAHHSESVRIETEINLDDHVELIESNNTSSWLLWWQPQFDYDADWPIAFLSEIALDSNNNRIAVFYNLGDTHKITVRIGKGGAATIDAESAALDFAAGDWIQIVVTVDWSDLVTLYINGVYEDAADISTFGTSPVEFNGWQLGATDTGASQSGSAYSGYAVLDSVLAPAEVAAIYQSGAPLTDQGATDTPVVAGDMIQLQISTANVSNPPTDAELTEAFGTPRNGFMALVDDAGAGTTVWKVWRAADAWWYEELTEAV